MKKSDLKQGMIVYTTGGRYGVVVIEDKTSKNCIKFFYDPEFLINYGYLSPNNSIEPFDSFDENLNVWYEDKLCYQIIKIFEINEIWNRPNLQLECNGLVGDFVIIKNII